MFLYLLTMIHSVFSGTISFEQMIEYRLSKSEAYFSLHLQHLGDENVKDVSVVLFMGNQEIVLGRKPQLIPKERLILNSQTYRTHQFKKPGVYVIPVVVHWTDLFHHQYQTLSSHDVVSGDVSQKNLFEMTPNHLSIESSTGLTRTEFKLKNITKDKLEFNITPFEVSGITLTPQPAHVELQPSAIQVINLAVMTPKLGIGSYGNILVVQSMNQQEVFSRAMSVTLTINGIMNELPVIFSTHRIIIGLIIALILTSVLVWVQWKQWRNRAHE